MSEEIRLRLREDLVARPADWCASKWILEVHPHIFSAVARDEFWNWKRLLGKNLGVDAKDVLITGSGAAGVSLNPYKNFKSFDDASDVDVAIVSPHHFDIAWRTLRSLGTRRYSLTREQQTSITDHVGRLIYWGTIATDRLLPIFPFANSWMAGLQEMARVPPTSDREINVRIYKDFASVRAYLTQGIKTLRNQELAGESARDTKIE